MCRSRPSARWKSPATTFALYRPSGSTDMPQTLLNTMNEERIEGAGDLGIFVRSWRPQSNARGVVVIVPGFNSHSGHYAWVAEQLTASGLAVYAVDLRGRGKSDGERFYVESISDWVSDVEAVMALAKTRESGL